MPAPQQPPTTFTNIPEFCRACHKNFTLHSGLACARQITSSGGLYERCGKVADIINPHLRTYLGSAPSASLASRGAGGSSAEATFLRFLGGTSTARIALPTVLPARDRGKASCISSLQLVLPCLVIPFSPCPRTRYPLISRLEIKSHVMNLNIKVWPWLIAPGQQCSCSSRRLLHRMCALHKTSPLGAADWRPWA